MFSKLFSKSNSYQYDDPLVSTKLSFQILHYIKEIRSPIIIVCIGTDRSTGDSLGPLIGTKLSEKRLKLFSVRGTLKNPVHALNLQETLDNIHKEFKNPYIIAVDACLGKTKNIGTITLHEGPVKPGAAVNKDLPPVGNIHITGIVNVSGFMEYLVLQNTRLYTVMELAKSISDSLYKADLLLSRSMEHQGKINLIKNTSHENLLTQKL